MQTISKEMDYNAIEMILNGSCECDRFLKYSKVFPFTNEPLDLYFDVLDFKNKSVLTVTASSDHPLGVMAEGASKIDCFDINVLTKYYYYFKRAAILTFNYNEYIEYFISLLTPGYGNSTSKDNVEFILEGYKRISERLDEISKELWDHIILENKGDLNKRLELIFYKCPIPHIKTSITEEQYKRLKEILPNYCISNFFSSDILSLPKQLNERHYDYILLSNIGDYLRPECFYGVISKLINNMTEKAKIVMYSLKEFDQLQEEYFSFKSRLPFTLENYYIEEKNTLSIVRKRRMK